MSPRVKEETHTQYLYSTRTLGQSILLTVDQVTLPPRGKNGETYYEDATIRINQQDGTCTVEKLEKLAQERVPLWLTDGMIRAQLCKMKPYGKLFCESRVDTSREWVDYNGCDTSKQMIKHWKEAINILLYGVVAQENFKSHGYQQLIIDWAITRYNHNKNSYSPLTLLINAVMRSGKCFIAYEIARMLGAKRILVVSSKPAVKKSWTEVLPGGNKSHVNYAGWKHHDYKKYKFGLPKFNSNCDVVFVSQQYINTHRSKFIKTPWNNPADLLSFIVGTDWDIVFFDEQHYGTDTENTQWFFDVLRYKLKVELSGTPFKTLLSGRVPKENTYNFDYIDEQTIRVQASKDQTSELWKQMQYRAQMLWAIIDVPVNIKKRVDVSGEGFTFAKLFAVLAAQFIDPQAVEEFLNFVHTSVYKRPPTQFANIEHRNDHTVWVMPNNVAAIAAMAGALENHDYWKKYCIINASGKNVKNIEEVTDIIGAVRAGKYPGKIGTIVLTCDRFLEGVTVPEWVTIHQMNDDRSAQAYFQSGFRNKSECKESNKTTVVVNDYNPQRCIEIIYKYCLDTVKPNQSTKDRVDEFLACSGLYDYDNGWKSVDGSEIIRRATESIEMHRSSFGDVVLGRDEITEELIELLQGKDFEGAVKVSTTLNDNNILAGKNKVVVSKISKKSEKPDDTVENTIKVMQTSFKRIPEMMFNVQVVNDKITNIQDLCTYPDEPLLHNHTGLTKHEWSYIVGMLGDIRINKMNRRIDALLHSGLLEDLI